MRAIILMIFLGLGGCAASQPTFHYDAKFVMADNEVDYERDLNDCKLIANSMQTPYYPSEEEFVQTVEVCMYQLNYDIKE